MVVLDFSKVATPEALRRMDRFRWIYHPDEYDVPFRLTADIVVRKPTFIA